MQSFEYLSVRYWYKETTGTWCAGSGRDRITHHHLDHTLPRFKKRGQLLQSKRTEGASIVARPSWHSPSRRRDHWGCPCKPPPRDATAATPPQGTPHRKLGSKERKLRKCRAPKAS